MEAALVAQLFIRMTPKLAGYILWKCIEHWFLAPWVYLCSTSLRSWTQLFFLQHETKGALAFNWSQPSVMTWWEMLLHFFQPRFFTPHVYDVSCLIVFTSNLCVSVCLMAEHTDVQTWILAWRSSGRKYPGQVICQGHRSKAKVMR